MFARGSGYGRRSRLWLVALGTVGVAAAAPGGVAAQAPDTTPVVEIPEVIVDVVRAPLELRETPHAVSTVVRTAAERAAPGLALDEALRFVPGVQVDNRYNYALGERISIRGMGARAQFGVRGVKVVFDGIPATLPDGQSVLGHIDPAFVHAAEVIRGPASALWGNAAGGVIQMYTVFPEMGERRHRGGVTAGSNGLLRTGIESSGRGADGAYLLQASRIGYEGYREFQSASSLRAHGRAVRRLGRGEVRVAAGAVRYDARNPGSLSEAALRDAPHLAFPYNVRQRTGERGSQQQAGLSWRGPSPLGKVEISGYVIGRSIENPIPPRIIDLDRTAGGLRGTLAGAAGHGGAAARWLVGFEGEMQRDDRRNFVNEQGDRGALALDQLERVTSLAPFGQVALSLAGRLTALAALRHDSFRFSADDRFVTAADPDDSGRRVLGALSPSLGLAFEMSPRAQVYTNATTSFETPTTTELANRPDGSGGFNPDLHPQRALSLEVGGRFAPWPAAAIDVALFNISITDALVPYEVEAIPGRQFFRNAGSSVHRGFELGASSGFGTDTRLAGAYTFTDARFGEFRVDDADHSGNRVPGVSPHRLDFGVAHEPRDGWSIGLDVAHSSATPVDDANEHHADPYLVLDASATMPLRLGRLQGLVLVGVDNVADRSYVSSVVVNAFGGRFYEPGPGRSFYVGISTALHSGGSRELRRTRTPIGRR